MHWNLALLCKAGVIPWKKEGPDPQRTRIPERRGELRCWKKSGVEKIPKKERNKHKFVCPCLRFKQLKM